MTETPELPTPSLWKKCLLAAAILLLAAMNGAIPFFHLFSKGDWLVPLLLGFCFAELGLLCVWASLGSLRAAVRLPCAAAGMAGVVGCSLLETQYTEELLLLYLPGVVGTLAATLVMRRRGFRLNRPFSRQFGIRDILLITAVAAATMGGLRLLAAIPEGHNTGMDTARLDLLIGAASTVVTLAALWTVMGLRPLYVRLAALGAVLALAAAIDKVFIPSPEPWILTRLFSVQAAMECLVLLGFRLGGRAMARPPESTLPEGAMPG